MRAILSVVSVIMCGPSRILSPVSASVHVRTIVLSPASTQHSGIYRDGDIRLRTMPYRYSPDSCCCMQTLQDADDPPNSRQNREHMISAYPLAPGWSSLTAHQFADGRLC